MLHSLNNNVSVFPGLFKLTDTFEQRKIIQLIIQHTACVQCLTLKVPHCMIRRHLLWFFGVKQAAVQCEHIQLEFPSAVLQSAQVSSDWLWCEISTRSACGHDGHMVSLIICSFWSMRGSSPRIYIHILNMHWLFWQTKQQIPFAVQWSGYHRHHYSHTQWTLGRKKMHKMGEEKRFAVAKTVETRQLFPAVTNVQTNVQTSTHVHCFAYWGKYSAVFRSIKHIFHEGRL